MSNTEHHMKSEGGLKMFKSSMTNGANNFYQSKRVTVQKVTFKNQYMMNVVGNLFLPKDLDQNRKNPAIIVGTQWVP